MNYRRWRNRVPQALLPFYDEIFDGAETKGLTFLKYAERILNFTIKSYEYITQTKEQIDNALLDVGNRIDEVDEKLPILNDRIGVATTLIGNLEDYDTIIANKADKTDLDIYANQSNKLSILGDITQTDLDNEVTDVRLIAPKFLKDRLGEKQDELQALTQTDIDNKTEVPRIVTGKFIAENVLPQDSGWQDLSLLNGWTIFSGHSLMIRKIGSIVQIKGIVNGLSKTDNVLCNIPLGYRPSRVLRYITWLGASANSEQFGSIGTNGNVLIYGTQSDLVIDYTYFVGYEIYMYLRIINKDTHEFIRDIDLKYYQQNSSYENEQGEMIQRENEIAITAPACVGSNCIATFYKNGRFKKWDNDKGPNEPKELKENE